MRGIEPGARRALPPFTYLRGHPGTGHLLQWSVHRDVLVSLCVETNWLILLFALSSGIMLNRMGGGFATWEEKGHRQGAAKSPPRSGTPRTSQLPLLLTCRAFSPDSSDPDPPVRWTDAGRPVRKAGSEKSRAQGTWAQSGLCSLRVSTPVTPHMSAWRGRWTAVPTRGKNAFQATFVDHAPLARHSLNPLRGLTRCSSQFTQKVRLSIPLIRRATGAQR